MTTLDKPNEPLDLNTDANNDPPANNPHPTEETHASINENPSKDIQKNEDSIEKDLNQSENLDNCTENSKNIIEEQKDNPENIIQEISGNTDNNTEISDNNDKDQENCSENKIQDVSKNTENKPKLGLMAKISTLLAAPALRFSFIFFIILVLATAALSYPALNIRNDNDVLKFLPQEDEKVKTFMDIGDRFHGLQMAIVGIEAVDDEGKPANLFTLENLSFIRLMAREFKQVEGVSSTTSFTEIKDISSATSEIGESMSAVTDLVPELPALGSEAAKSPELQKVLDDVKKRALSLDHVAGFLVSKDGSSAALYAQIETNADVKVTSDILRQKIEQMREATGAKVKLYYGGSPFIGGYSADQVRLDMMHLSPIVFAIIVLIIFVTSKSAIATAIALLSVLVSVVFVLGGMEVLDIPMTLVSTSLPVLLIALGSAYSIHLLNASMGHLDKGEDRKQAALNGLKDSGPAIILSAITTAAGFISFLLMDVEPMRDFGLAMSAATLVIMLVTLWIVTSTFILFPIKTRKEGRAPEWAIRGIQNASNAMFKHSVVSAIVFVLLIGVAAFFVTKVETQNDNSRLFSPGSEPIVSDQFMVDRFGGSNFVQIEIQGDVNTAPVLRQMERITAYSNADPRVAGVQSLSDVIAMPALSMAGERRIVPSTGLNKTLATLAMAEDDSVRLMADAEWKHSLIQIRVKGSDLAMGSELASDLGKLYEEIMKPRIAINRNDMDDKAKQTEIQEITQHLQWIYKKYAPEQMIDQASFAKILEDKSMHYDQEEVKTVLNLNLFLEDEAILYVDSEKTTLEAFTQLVTTTLNQGSYSQDWLAAQLRTIVLPEELENEKTITTSAKYIHDALIAIGTTNIRKNRASKIYSLAKIDNPSEKLIELTEGAIWGLTDDIVFLPEEGFEHYISENKVLERASIKVVPSGYPVIYVAMNESVKHNQMYSLFSSAIIVFFVLLLFTRSPILAFFGLIPPFVTVVLIFGIMGAFDITMDVGSSMICAISLGVGVDYACHLLWKFGKPSKENAHKVSNEMIRSTGWGIVINALEIGLGLSVLYFGAMRPMCFFGVLTGLAMIISAIVSLLVLPGLFQWATRFFKQPSITSATPEI